MNRKERWYKIRHHYHLKSEVSFSSKQRDGRSDDKLSLTFTSKKKNIYIYNLEIGLDGLEGIFHRCYSCE